MRETAPFPAVRLFVLGLVIWLAATLAFRLFGHLVLVPGDRLRTAAVFAAAIPLVYLLMSALLRAFRLEGGARAVAATLLLAPGLLLDGLVSIPFFGTVFPNMAGSVAAPFGALMCVGYSTGFLVSLLPVRGRRSRKAPATPGRA